MDIQERIVNGYRVRFGNDRTPDETADAWKYCLEPGGVWSLPFDTYGQAYNAAIVETQALRDTHRERGLRHAAKPTAETCCFNCTKPATHKVGSEVYFPMCDEHFAAYGHVRS